MQSEKLRIIFFGTADLACPSLTELSEREEFSIVVVVTQPDRPKGRDLKVRPSRVKIEALQRNIPVLQPERARDPAFIRNLAELSPKLIVVAAYGQILPPAMLDLPTHGCLNVHTSLLPKYRGAAPIQWAILNDESETGVTIMKMDAGLDTGDILTQEQTPIEATDDAQTLHDRLSRIGAKLLVRTIPEYLSGTVAPRKQPEEGVSYARKITKEDGRLDWSLPARSLWNRVRAFTPWPGAFTKFPGAVAQPILKIWEAEIAPFSGPPGEVLEAEKNEIVIACGDQALRILSLQRESGRRLGAAQFLAGQPLSRGQRFE